MTVGTWEGVGCSGLGNNMGLQSILFVFILFYLVMKIEGSGGRLKYVDSHSEARQSVGARQRKKRK